MKKYSTIRCWDTTKEKFIQLFRLSKYKTIVDMLEDVVSRELAKSEKAVK